MQNRSIGESRRAKQVKLGGLAVLSILLLLLITACGAAPAAETDATAVQTGQQEEAAAPTATPLPVEEVSSAYPATDAYPPPLPTLPPLEGSYPVATLPPPTSTPSVYPPPATEEPFAEPRFRLDPVSAGDSVVTGQAIPGMSLAVIDVTYGGNTLGTGRADDQGRFSINVQDLVEGNRLGITFGELEDGLGIAEMSIKYYPHRGEGFRNLPNVGIVLDSNLIAP
ncbi:MAG: Ig-like domain-containing protein [Candidatus Promineifilaceae bacterium]